jgi:hypothetical protein
MSSKSSAVDRRVPIQFTPVTRGGTQRILALIGVALAALALSACGGGSSDGGSSASESGSTEAATPGSETSGGAPAEEKQGGKKGGAHPAQAEKGPKDHTAAEVSVPLKVSGGGSGQFVVKGGDNSIQEFGDESDESELRLAGEAVHAFFVARATGHWADACSRMSASLRERLEELARKSEVHGCANFLEAFTTQLPASAWRQVTTMDAGSLRLNSEEAFLVYTGAEGTVYAMPLKEEGGEWKVTALTAAALPGV